MTHRKEESGVHAGRKTKWKESQWREPPNTTCVTQMGYLVCKGSSEASERGKLVKVSKTGCNVGVQELRLTRGLPFLKTWYLHHPVLSELVHST